MANELVTQEQLNELLATGFTGHPLGSDTVYPPVLNVLQSDKQYDAFIDSDTITKKMYGKLFIRKDTNMTTDLVDSIEGTIIKIEKGYEVRNPDDNSIVASGIDFANTIQKEQYSEQGLRVINMVKLLIATRDSKETEEMLRMSKELIEKGEQPTKNDNPFTVVVIKGSSFGSWFDAENDMYRISKEVYHKPVHTIPATSFKVSITSNKEKNDKGQEYYSLNCKVSANDISEAIAFTKYMLEMKNVSMFFKVKEAVERQEEAKAKREEAKKLAFSKIDSTEDLESENVEIVDDLPF